MGYYYFKAAAKIDGVVWQTCTKSDWKQMIIKKIKRLKY